MAKAKAAGTLRIEDSPEWQEMQARGARIKADLREAEAELEAARGAWREGTKDLKREDVRRYLDGELEAKDLGRAGLPGLQERIGEARKRIDSVRDALGEHSREESALRSRLTRSAAREAFSAYAEIERRILRASADLLDAARDKRALLDGLHARGFHHVGNQLHRLLVEAAGVDGTSTRDTLQAGDLQAGFLHDLAGKGSRMERYVIVASKALGGELPTGEVH